MFKKKLLGHGLPLFLEAGIARLIENEGERERQRTYHKLFLFTFFLPPPPLPHSLILKLITHPSAARENRIWGLEREKKKERRKAKKCFSEKRLTLLQRGEKSNVTINFLRLEPDLTLLSLSLLSSRPPSRSRQCLKAP